MPHSFYLSLVKPLPICICFWQLVGSIRASCQWISWWWLHPLNYGCTTKISIAVQIQYQLSCIIYFFTTTLSTTPILIQSSLGMSVGWRCKLCFFEPDDHTRNRNWEHFSSHLTLHSKHLFHIWSWQHFSSHITLHSKHFSSHLTLHSKYFFLIWNWEHFSKHLTLHWKHFFHLTQPLTFWHSHLKWLWL